LPGCVLLNKINHAFYFDASLGSEFFQQGKSMQLGATLKFEFGSKVSFVIIHTTNIIVSIVTFMGNPYDSATLEKN